MICFVIVACGVYAFVVKLHAKQLFHSTFKLYMASLGFLVFFLFIECIAYGKYANDGLDNYGLKTFGK